MISSIFVQSLMAEWLKTRHTVALRLVLLGAIFIPTMMTLFQIYASDKFSYHIKKDQFWPELYVHSWEYMAVLLLPLGVILVTSQLAQIEFKNQTWKQTLITPQPLFMVYFNKLAIIFFLLLCFFLMFNIAIVISGYLPGLIMPSIDMPQQGPPWMRMAKDSFAMWLTCLPIVALQYAISIRFANFVTSLSFGIVMVIAAIFALKWKHGFLIPYSYCSFHFINMSGEGRFHFPLDIYWCSTITFVVFSAIGYLSFQFRTYRA
jgi:lantibiotic transport system permease protein